MVEIIETTDRDRVDMFKGIVMEAINAHLLVREGGVDAVDILNGAMNAVTTLLRGAPTDEVRLNLTAQAVRLLLIDAGCAASDVLDEVERIKMADVLLDGEVQGRA